MQLLTVVELWGKCKPEFGVPPGGCTCSYDNTLVKVWGVNSSTVLFKPGKHALASTLRTVVKECSPLSFVKESLCSYKTDCS